MDFVNDLFKQLTSLGPEMLVALIVIVAGYVLRLVPRFPNKLIPLACLVVAAVLYPLIAPAPKPDPALRHPAVRQVLIGMLIGFLAWIGHNKFLNPLEDKWPWLKGFFDDDTTPPAPPVGNSGESTMLKSLFVPAALLAAALMTGCAYMHSSTVRSTDPKTGIVTEKTDAHAWALCDSSSQLTHFRNQSSPSTNAAGGTYAPGTYAAGLNENASSTNAVQVLNALGGVLGKIPW